MFRISDGTPIIPTSCSRETVTMSSTSDGGIPSPVAISAASLAVPRWFLPV